MNTWNTVENHLRKWTPRPPSPELRRRIFGEAEGEALKPLLSLGEISRWLVPAFGCFLLVLSSLSVKFQEKDLHRYAATNLLPITSNGESSATLYYSRSAEHSDINNVPCQRLEYNFGKSTPRSVLGSFLISYTNRLIE